MKHNTDKKRQDVEYKVGQMVYVKLRPHHHISVQGTHHHHKLTKRYFGPFRILERIGSVTYCLQLLIESRIHPVFHCSLLRPHHEPLDLDTSPLPPEAINNHPILEPLTILASQTDSSTTLPTRLVLVQWVGLAPKDSTWEKWKDIRKLHHLEDKVLFQGGVMIATTTIRDRRLTRSQQRKS